MPLSIAGVQPCKNGREWAGRTRDALGGGMVIGRRIWLRP